MERKLESISNVSTNFALGRKMELANILSFLDTLEVKEVDSTNALIEKACEYLEPILTEYARFYVGGDILQYFRKAMEE